MDESSARDVYLQGVRVDLSFGTVADMLAVDILPSKNQSLRKYCTHASNN